MPRPDFLTTLRHRLPVLADPSGVAQPLPRFDRAAKIAIGLAMAMLVFVGTYQALTAGPWRWRDERAHVGYVMELAKGHIPDVDTPIPVPDHAAALEERLAETPPKDGMMSPHAKVWVANHPPGAYVLALPGVWAGKASGSGNMIVLSLRLANVLGAAAAVLATALLARELTGRTSPAVVAAALTATCPYLLFFASTAMTDGVTLAFTVGVLWATARALRRGFDRNATAVVAALSVACGLTRLTALGTAAIAVGVALAIHAARRRRVPWRPALMIGGSVAVLTGWFWGWNIVRYGDIAGSEVLYDRFNRSPTGTVLRTLGDTDMWTRVVGTVLQNYRDSAPGFHGRFQPLTIGILVLASIGLLATLDDLSLPVGLRRWATGLSRTGRRADRVEPLATGSAQPTGPGRGGAWLVVAAGSLAAATMMSQHVSSGGNAFGRYVLVVVPIVACLIGAVVGLFRRPAPAAILGVAITTIYVRHSHAIWTDFPAATRLGLQSPLNSPVRRPLGPSWAQDMCRDLGTITAILLIVAVGVAVVTSCRADRSELRSAGVAPVA